MTVLVGDRPWQNPTPMEDINRFVVLAQSGLFSVTDLCERFGISRKTGYKHLEIVRWGRALRLVVPTPAPDHDSDNTPRRREGALSPGPVPFFALPPGSAVQTGGSNGRADPVIRPAWFQAPDGLRAIACEDRLLPARGLLRGLQAIACEQAMGHRPMFGHSRRGFVGCGKS